MSTRGYVKIKGKYYYLRSDAYPSFAEERLSYAVKHAKTPKGIIKIANRQAGFDWINSPLKKSEVKESWDLEHGYHILGKTVKHKIPEQHKVWLRKTKKYPDQPKMWGI